MPAIVALSVEGILPTLERFIQAREKNIHIASQSVPTPALMAHATTTAPIQPLPEHVVNSLLSHYPSMRLLEEATRTNSGRNHIVALVGPIVASSLVDFWEDEWIA